MIKVLIFFFLLNPKIKNVLSKDGSQIIQSHLHEDQWMDLLLSPEAPHAASDGLKAVILYARPYGGQLDGAQIANNHAHIEDALTRL